MVFFGIRSEVKMRQHCLHAVNMHLDCLVLGKIFDLYILRSLHIALCCNAYLKQIKQDYRLCTWLAIKGYRKRRRKNCLYHNSLNLPGGYNHFRV
jgi:hypothetical protein